MVTPVITTRLSVFLRCVGAHRRKAKGGQREVGRAQTVEQTGRKVTNVELRKRAKGEEVKSGKKCCEEEEQDKRRSYDKEETRNEQRGGEWVEKREEN